MTATFRRVNRGRNHWYVDVDGIKIPSVTSILSSGLPKPALTTWAANTAAAYAVDHWDELQDMTPSARIAKIKGSPWAERDAAALRGTQIHSIAEQLAAGAEVAYPEAQAGHVESAVRFLDDWQVTPVLQEFSVAHLRYRYAGTGDLIADLADGNRWLLDYKTSKGVYGETGFQLAAYRYAEFYLDDDGQAQPMIDVDRVGVVHLRADGYDLRPVQADEAVFLQFRYIAQTALAAEAARDYVGEALTA